MAKAIKKAVIAAVVVFAVVSIPFVGGSLGTIFTATSALGGLSIALQYAIMTFATTLISSGIGQMTSKGIDANNANFGTKASTRGSLNPRQIIYGETKVGSTITFLRTTGTDNSKLSMYLVFAGHEIESFETVFFNDVALSVSSSTLSGAGSNNSVFTVTNSDFTNTDNDESFTSGSLARFTLADGSQTTHDSLARSTHGSTVIDNNFKLQGCAYMYVELIYDAEKMPQLPKITAKIKGKKLYDPRLDSTVGGSGTHRLTDASTHAWSDNPALCILDFLSNTTYGIKATADELNLSANAGGFMSAANTCEQSVSGIGGITQERYTANGFTNMGADGTGIIEGLLSSCGGKMTFTNGKFNVFVAAAQTPSLTIVDDEILSPISVTKNTQSNELFNSVKAIYVDKDNQYTATDTPELTNSTFVSEDVPTGESNANYLKRMELQLPYTQTTQMAQRLAKIALQHQRKTLQASFLTTTKYLRLQPCDFVYITNDRLNWSAKMFEVISTQLEFVEQDEVPVAVTRLVVKEIEAATYDFVSNDYVTPVTQGPISEVPSKAYEMSQPSSLALSQVLTIDGTTSKINIKASWTNSTSPYLFGTEVSYKLSSDSVYQAINVSAGTSQAFIPNVTVGQTYNVRVRHFSDQNVFSAYTSNVNITIQAQSTAPNAPSNASVTTGKPLHMFITYTNPNNSDLKAVKIYRKTTNSEPTSDSDGLVNTQYGSPNSISTWMDGQVNGLTAGTNYFYWVRSCNHSDVHSGFVSVGTGNFVTVTSAESITSNIDRPSFFYISKTGNTNAPSNSEFQAVAGRNPIANDMVIVTRTDTSPDLTKAYKHDGSSFSEVSNLISGDMMVDGTIGADQIVAAGLNADIITAGTLNVNRIPSSVVFTSELTDGSTSISGSNIDTGTINASNVNITNLNATNINAGTLNANRINLNGSTLTVTSDGLEINNDGVGFGQIGSNAVGAYTVATAGVTSVSNNTSQSTFSAVLALASNQASASPTTMTGMSKVMEIIVPEGQVNETNAIHSMLYSGQPVQNNGTDDRCGIVFLVRKSDDSGSTYSHHALLVSGEWTGRAVISAKVMGKSTQFSTGFQYKIEVFVYARNWSTGSGVTSLGMDLQYFLFSKLTKV